MTESTAGVGNVDTTVLVGDHHGSAPTDSHGVEEISTDESSLSVLVTDKDVVGSLVTVGGSRLVQDTAMLLSLSLNDESQLVSQGAVEVCSVQIETVSLLSQV